MPEFDMNYAFFIVGILLTFAILASKLSSFFGTPLLLLFLSIGMLTGEDGIILHLYYTDYSSAFFIANLMLAVILLDGGLRTSFSMMKNVAAESAVLATVGVILTSGITGLIAYLLLDISLIQALLLGCIVGSTDAAAVFSLLGKDKNVSLKSNVSNTLQIESATNDPMAILLTTTMIAFASQKATSFTDALIFFVQHGRLHWLYRSYDCLNLILRCRSLQYSRYWFRFNWFCYYLIPGRLRLLGYLYHWYVCGQSEDQTGKLHPACI